MATTVTTHPQCGKTWTGLRKEHCAACHETFAGTTVGNAHRRGEFGADRRCINPADAGLVQDGAGVWHRPGSFNPEEN